MRKLVYWHKRKEYSHEKDTKNKQDCQWKNVVGND